MKIKARVPDRAREIIKTLMRYNYEAYFVGGCVRDIINGITPHDWDICTSATPEEMKEVFTKSKPTNFSGRWNILETGIKHGTLTIGTSEKQMYEVTTFRVDGNYSDGRHPDEVTWSKSLEEDLSRRDFTINAMALKIDKIGFELIDPFNGFSDIQNKILRCVGDPDERFQEDALRILRAMRFASVKNYEIEAKTKLAIYANYQLLSKVSMERISSELKKIVCGGYSYQVLRKFSSVICFIIPELEPCIGCFQFNPYHQYDVYDHIIHSVEACSSQDPIPNMALLLHDIMKPATRTTDEKGINHFPMHAIESAYAAKRILTRMKFSNKEIEDIFTLIKYHDSTHGKPTKAMAKRVLANHGTEQLAIWHIAIRVADIKAQRSEGMSERIDEVLKLRDYIDEAIKNKDCFNLSMLAIKGDDLINELSMEPGPKIGKILNGLLELVVSGVIPNSRNILLQYASNMKE